MQKSLIKGIECVCVFNKKNNKMIYLFLVVALPCHYIHLILGDLATAGSDPL